MSQQTTKRRSVHAPTPWRVDDHGRIVDARGNPVVVSGLCVASDAERIASPRIARNMALIVEAVNAAAAQE